jgi:hypothetical protein
MCVLCLLLFPVAVLDQETTLTLDQALEMARKRAPIILSARARIEEARGRLKGASLLFQQNPSLEADVGPRLASPNKRPERREPQNAAELGIMRHGYQSA